MEDFGLIESNGIRNKDPTRRRASKIFFPLSLFSATLRMDFSSVSTDKRNGSAGGGSISRSIDYDRCKKARQCPRSRPCIGNCIVAACRRLSRLSLLGINARTRALQVFSRKEQSSTACLGPTAWKKDLRSVNVSRERERRGLSSLLVSSSARIFPWYVNDFLKKVSVETFLRSKMEKRKCKGKNRCDRIRAEDNFIYWFHFSRFL